MEVNGNPPLFLFLHPEISGSKMPQSRHPENFSLQDTTNPFSCAVLSATQQTQFYNLKNFFGQHSLMKCLVKEQSEFDVHNQNSNGQNSYFSELSDDFSEV